MNVTATLHGIASFLKDSVSDFESMGFTLQSTFAKAITTKQGFLAKGRVDLVERTQDVIDHLVAAKQEYQMLKSDLGKFDFKPIQKEFQLYLPNYVPEKYV